MKRAVLTIVAIFAVAGASSAQTVESFLFESPRLSALGGPHAAQGVGMDAFLENPAGFATEDTGFSVARLDLSAAGPLSDIAAIMLGGSDLTSALPSLLDDQGRLYMGMDLAGPIFAGYVGRGLGVALMGKTSFTLDAVSLLNASLVVHTDAMLAGGYSFRIRAGEHTIDMGIMAKLMLRLGFSESGTAEDLTNTMMAFNTILASLPFTGQFGVGVDAGIKWTSPFGLAVGLTGSDPYSPVWGGTYPSFIDFLSGTSGTSSTGVLHPDLSAGLSYDLPFRFLDRLGLKAVIMADYRDFLDLLSLVPRNAILNVSLGLEVSVFEVMTLRAGMREALPAAGVGFEFGLFQLDLSMYGRELGLEPGSRPSFNMDLAMSFEY